jgi:hypothetical protein
MGVSGSVSLPFFTSLFTLCAFVLLESNKMLLMTWFSFHLALVIFALSFSDIVLGEKFDCV